MPRWPSTEERFWAAVEKTDTCWLWTSTVDRGGYGRLMVNRRYERAHRYSYLLAHGSINPALTIDHLCRVTTCVNPAHLEQVTMEENWRRRPRVEACVNGHDFSPANTYVHQGRRCCRACNAAAARRAKARRLVSA